MSWQRYKYGILRWHRFINLCKGTILFYLSVFFLFWNFFQAVRILPKIILQGRLSFGCTFWMAQEKGPTVVANFCEMDLRLYFWKRQKNIRIRNFADTDISTTTMHAIYNGSKNSIVICQTANHEKVPPSFTTVTFLTPPNTSQFWDQPQLSVRKIFKFVATRCQISRLKFNIG